MKSPLDELLGRTPPDPTNEEAKIPWHDPAFSERMLRVHLSQLNDQASRRFEIVDEQVAWLHDSVLGGKAARVLDLGCGPGFYTSRLAERGHSCLGVDFSPSSIAHAQAEAHEKGLDCRYVQSDVLEFDAGGEPFDLVLILYGELNTFGPTALDRLLATARNALAPGGHVVLEPSREELPRTIGEQPASWNANAEGLFADAPHLVLRETFWFEEKRASVERYFVITEGDEIATYHSTTYAYAEAEIREALQRAGFDVTQQRPCLTGRTTPVDPDLYVLVARAV